MKKLEELQKEINGKEVMYENSRNTELKMTALLIFPPKVNKFL